VGWNLEDRKLRSFNYYYYYYFLHPIKYVVDLSKFGCIYVAIILSKRREYNVFLRSCSDHCYLLVVSFLFSLITVSFSSYPSFLSANSSSVKCWRPDGTSSSSYLAFCRNLTMNSPRNFEWHLLWTTATLYHRFGPVSLQAGTRGKQSLRTKEVPHCLSSCGISTCRCNRRRHIALVFGSLIIVKWVIVTCSFNGGEDKGQYHCGHLRCIMVL
jgi:hypothetical protein